jgi:hypothetical protein
LVHTPLSYYHVLLLGGGVSAACAAGWRVQTAPSFSGDLADEDIAHKHDDAE